MTKRIWHVRPAKTRISLGIRPVWSESSLYAQWVAKDPSFLHVDSEDADQTGRMPRLIWVFAGLTVTLLVLSCRGSNCLNKPRHEKTCLRGLRPGKTQTSRLLSWWDWLGFEISAIGNRCIILCRQRTTKALNRLLGCAGWFVPLLFAYGKSRFSHDVAQIRCE